MRIGCLQFAPQLGDVDNNLNRADAVLSKANPQNLDLLVLPELAFSGYNFRSLQHISPYLEPTTSGITSLWARTTALKYDCVVTVGYPEKVDVSNKWPTSPEYYNSAITVNADGETIANYRKSFLYYTDETWALEGPDGFYDGEIGGLGNVAMGICKWPTKSFERMDLNPYKFEAPWSAWEFAYHILHKQANLVVLSMAWLTREDSRSYSRLPKEPDMDTLSYWLARLEPLIRAETEGEIICVFANRTGSEEEATYAGTSAVLGIHAGEVKVYGILGRGERELLVVDTSKRPQAKLVSEPNSLARNAQQEMAHAKAAKSSRDRSRTREHSVDRTNPFEKLKGSREERHARKRSTSRPKRAERSDSKSAREDRKRSREQSTERSQPSPPQAPEQTNVTLDTKRFVPNGRSAPLSVPLTLEAGITTLSPVDPSSQSAYYGRRPTPETHLVQLHSSIAQLKVSEPKQDSPTFYRPASPKSRNVSRNRNVRSEEHASMEQDFASADQALTAHDSAKDDEINHKPTSATPPSVKEDGINHKPTSVTPPFAKDERITSKPASVSPPLQSAATTLAESTTPSSPFISQSAHTSPRPNSTVW